MLPDTLPDRAVSIVGPNRLQNTLLAHCLQEQCRVSIICCVCSVAGIFDSMEDEQRVILFDCYAKELSIIEECRQETELLQLSSRLALFNVDHCAGIEKSAIELGIRGIFYLDDTIEKLLKGLSAIFSGDIWFSRHDLAEICLASSVRNHLTHGVCHSPPNQLTRREVEILRCLSRGATNEVISCKLFISINTVRTHLRNIFRKISVSNRLEASQWAITHLI